MNPSPASCYVPVAALATEQGRLRLVKAVIAFTEGTALYPASYERQLLDQFVRGQLTIDEVAQYLEQYSAGLPAAHPA
jgi:hypothetical protein